MLDGHNKNTSSDSIAPNRKRMSGSRTPQPAATTLSTPRIVKPTLAIGDPFVGLGWPFETCLVQCASDYHGMSMKPGDTVTVGIISAGTPKDAAGIPAAPTCPVTQVAQLRAPKIGIPRPLNGKLVPRFWRPSSFAIMASMVSS